MQLTEDQVTGEKEMSSLFASFEEQVAKWRQCLTSPEFQGARGVDLDGFLSKNPAPAWYRFTSRLTTSILVLCGPSACEELKSYWPLIERPTNTYGEWRNEVVFQEELLRWCPGSGNLMRDWHFEWQFIDLDVCRNCPTATVRKTSTLCSRMLPTAGLLATLLIHDQYTEHMNGGEFPYLLLAGYETNGDSTDAPRDNVPAVTFVEGRGVYLKTASATFRRRCWCVPKFHELPS